MSTAPRVGIVGAGQLARMTALAAAALGIRVTVLASRPGEAADFGPATYLEGSPERLSDLRRLAAVSDVVTFDHEGVPAAHLRALDAEGARIEPRPEAKLLAQDKAHQREVLGGRMGIPVPEHATVRSAGDVARFAAKGGWPVALKARGGGYDGRGVWITGDAASAEAALGEARALGADVLAERFVAVDRELAVVLARSTTGEIATYPVVETIQCDGMCREVLAPTGIQAEVAEAAARLARRVAEGIGATGILAVELFLRDGELLVNELALRPHNSGHWTLGGCVTSQFENHVRAVLGLPLGSAAPIAAAAVMVNVLGPPDGSDPRARLHAALGVPGVHVQLYGKAPRPGRKLGHVTAVGASAPDTRKRAWRAAAALEGARGGTGTSPVSPTLASTGGAAA